jgi:hypothetical protein
MQQGKNIYFSLLDELETKVMTPPETDNKYLHWMYELDEEEKEKLERVPVYIKENLLLGKAISQGIIDGLASQCTFAEPVVPEFLRKDFILPQAQARVLADNITASMGIPEELLGVKKDVIPYVKTDTE